MKTFARLTPVLVATMLVSSTSLAANASETPRVIMVSDFPPLDVIPGGGGKGPPEKLSDPDDIQSMVRFLLYTNDLEVEGLIASAGTHANIANKKNILEILDLYDQVDENLRRHDARYPTADKLRAVAWQGRSGTWGKPVDVVIGEGKDTEASEAIIRVVDRPDPRPVWVGIWGGPADVAQAIWKVRETRSPGELKRFLGKLRIFMIGLGDKTGQDGSGQWMLDTFPELFIIVSQRTYGGMFAQKTPLGSLEWLDKNIREGHGPLGAIYPRSGYYIDNPGMQEGDTPTFLHLVSALRGLNDPETPSQEGWGGHYVQRDPAKRHWYDGPGPDSIRKWLPDIQADFAKRADWMLPVSPAGNVSLRWGGRLLKKVPEWYASAEARAAAENVLRYQSSEGAWPKNTDLLAPATDEEIAVVQRGGKANTIDNGATTAPIRFLALVGNATNERKYHDVALRGLDYLLAAQYPNGGFPQFFPLHEGYFSHITYNDGAMINALDLLRDVAAKRTPFAFVDAERRAQAAEAVARGVDCILKTQIRQDGKLTAWCAQHNARTLEPAWARAYEPPSLSGAESVGIVRFLMEIEKPTPEIVAAIEGAVAWFREVVITGQRLDALRRDDGRLERIVTPDPGAPPVWARFYELGSNRPLFIDRDSKPNYDFMNVSYERRSGYGYHTTAPTALLERD